MTDSEIRFLTLEEVHLLHDDQIRRYGGSHGIRDERLLESAIAQPETQFGGAYLHESITAMAAAYLFHLVQNHPFIDGNKRIGAACAAAFLALNGYEIDPELDQLDPDTGRTAFEEAVLAVARGEMDKSALTLWINNALKPAT